MPVEPATPFRHRRSSPPLPRWEVQVRWARLVLCLEYFLDWGLATLPAFREAFDAEGARRLESGA